jgi:hypothetical protein
VKDEPKTTVPGCAAAEIIRFMLWSLEALILHPRRNSRLCSSLTIIAELPLAPKA